MFKYYFQWYSPVRGGALRAMHTMDIPFVFENYEMASALVGTGPELKPLGDRMAGGVGGVCDERQPEPRAHPDAGRPTTPRPARR